MHQYRSVKCLNRSLCGFSSHQWMRSHLSSTFGSLSPFRDASGSGSELPPVPTEGRVGCWHLPRGERGGREKRWMNERKREGKIKSVHSYTYSTAGDLLWNHETVEQLKMLMVRWKWSVVGGKTAIAGNTVRWVTSDYNCCISFFIF